MDSPENWDELCARAMIYLKHRQEELQSEYSLGTWPRFDYDMDRALLIFSSGGRAGIVSNMSIVGSISKSSGTWLWSWENPSVPEVARRDIDEVRAFGKQHQYERLSHAKWAGEEVDGWEMTAISALLLNARGAYRVPTANGALFMILRDILTTDGVGADTPASHG